MSVLHKEGMKFYCLCMMESGEEVIIAMRGWTEAEASKKVHAGYAVEFVLDVLTPFQMEFRKRHLRRSYLSNASVVS